MLKRILGIGLAAAMLIVAGPALALSTPTVFDVDIAGADHRSTDCFASFDASRAILLVEAETGCDLILSEATGLCLVPVTFAQATEVIGLLDPIEGAFCASFHPSPPG